MVESYADCAASDLVGTQNGKSVADERSRKHEKALVSPKIKAIRMHTKSGEKLMKKMNSAVSFVLIVLAAIAGFTCTVGLGGQIGILPPVGEIIYPDVGETPIRSSFVLKGTANDDDGIKSITVVFKNIDTREESKEYIATGFSERDVSASWKVEIDNESKGNEPGHELVKVYPIPDGEYTAIVTVTDVANNKTTFTKNYKIDNTPPVFIVSRPSKYIEDNTTPSSSDPADGYGAVFSVVGQAGEKNAVEMLKVTVPDTTVNPIESMYVGNNVDARVAVYSTAPTNPLYDLQAQAPSKPLRGQLYLYDNARECKGTGALGEGNKADWYYMRNEIYTDVIAKGYTPEVISDYFAGKKGSDANEHDKKIKALRNDTVALAKLKSAMIKMSDMRSSFKLDPSKSPGFKVIGSKHLSTTTDEIKGKTPAEASTILGQASAIMFKAGGDASFVVELIPNKDTIPLVGGSNAAAYKASKIKIVLYKWGSTNNAFDTDHPITLVDFDTLTDAYLSSHPDLIKTEGDKLRIQCTFPSAQGEGIYAVDVQGRDTSNEESNEFKAYDNSDTASGMYAIKFYSAGSGPRTRPIRLDGYKKADAKFIIAADVTGIDTTNGHVYCNIGTTVSDSDIELKKATTAANDPRYEVEVEITKIATGGYVVKWNDPAGTSKQKNLPASFSDGPHTIKFLSKAGPGLTDTDDIDFIFDTKAPEIREIFSPDLSKNQSGDFTMRGSVVDNLSGVKSIKYIVGKQDNNNINVQPAESATGWKNIALSGDNWSIDFTGSNNITDKTKAPTLGKKVGSDELYDIPVFFLVEDKAAEKDTQGGAAQKGNTAIIPKVLRIDPNGDIPIVTVSTPDANQVLGGTIRISGLVSVPDPSAGRVASVWIQITDKKDGSGNPNFTQNAMFGIVNWCPNPDGKQLSSTGTNPEYKSGGSYWSLEINGDKTFEPSSGTQRDIWFRLRGKNAKGVAGQWTKPVKITVDKAAPTITGMKVATQAKIGTAIPSSVDPENQTYVSNMWIKGDNLYLCADLAHNAGIEQIEIGGNYVTGSTGTTLTGNAEITSYQLHGVPCFVQNGSNYKMQIPLKTTANPGSDNGFNITIKIKAKKQGNIEGLTASTTFSFKYDNTAPTAVFGTKIASSGTVTVSETSFSDSALVGKTNIDKTMKVFASGQDIKITAFDKTTGTVTLAYAPTNPTMGYLIYSPIEYLLPDGNNKVSVVGAAYDVGSGVEKIKVNYNGITSTEIELESPSGVLTDVGNGDVNFVTWKGVIDVSASTIVDGKGKIVITPIDRAHNKPTAIETDVKLKKNLLKITEVSLGTDINRNGAIANADSTVETKKLTLKYDAAYEPDGIDSKDHDWHGKADGGTFRFKNNKSQIKITAEDVGATAKKYTLKRKKISDSLPEVEVHNLRLLPSNGIIELTQADFDKITQSANLETSNPTKLTLALTVWNSVSGLTVGTDTWKAELELDVIVDTKDRIVPTNVIDPFKWVSETENSLYGNSRKNGHIEIGTDLDKAIFNQTSGLMDTNDKVSGKISITGTAHDDQVITEIWAKIDGFKFDGIAGAATVGAETKLVEYEKNAGGTVYTGKFKDVGTGTYVYNPNYMAKPENTAASADKTKYENYIKARDKFFNEKGWLLTIVNSEFSVETGHTVKWQLDWNTEKITGVVGLDKAITIKVKDTEQVHEVSASRKVDVVPYITGITTTLSELGSNASVYNRTALGKYPVADTEEITVEGFNLTGAAYTLKGTSLTASGTKYKIGSATSGELVATVNSVTSINNKNANTKPYNKEPNNVNNDELNDDRLIDVWQFKKVATPANGFISYPVLKISPKDGSVGLAYANGVEYFNMAGFGNAAGQTDYKGARQFDRNWAQYVHTDFVFDEMGYTYGMATGVDMNSGQSGGIASYSKFVSRRPGSISAYNNYGNPGGSQNGIGLRLENIGTTNTPYTADPDRIQSPSITTVAGNAANEETFIYLAYYDAINQHIRYRWGSVSKENSSPFHKYDGQLIDLTGYGKMQEPPATSFSILAGPPAKAYSTDTGGSTQTGAANNSGQYVSLAAVKASIHETSHDVVTAVWYNFKERSLMYAHTTGNPRTDNVAWSTPVKISAGGEYVRSVADPSGGIHVAFYDSGNLKYAYLPKYDSTNWSVVIVDSFSLTGTHVSIDLARAKANGKWIPYISYYMQGGASAKLAYLVDEAAPNEEEKQAGKGDGSIKAGALPNEKFTGSWEVSIVPTEHSIREYRINVGVYKDKTTGVMQAIPQKADSGSDAAGWVTGGNGTTNPLVGYAVREDGAFETAQKK